MTQIATAPTAAVTPAAPTTVSRAAEARRHYLTGTPGRMRVYAALASLLCLAFALSGLFGLRALDGSIDRAGANTEQLVRVQQIYANLLKADAATTNGFLKGGLEPAALRESYDTAIAAVQRDIADAATAQPADGKALAALNESVQQYTSYIDQARAYNREALPVGAQYLTLASQQLRSDILPIVANLRDANKDRADHELRAGWSGWLVVAIGLITLAVLAWIALWLARSTHRYLNLPLTAAIALILAGVVLIGIDLTRAGRTMSSVRSGSFSSAVELASARAEAYDAKSNESLTLIKRGSGAKYEQAYVTAMAAAREHLSAGGYPQGTTPDLLKDLAAYDSTHKDIRAQDDAGDWDSAVQQAVATGAGSANEAFTTFDAQASSQLALKVKDAVNRLDSLKQPLYAWLVGLAGLLAALLSARSMTKRIEEYR